MTKDNPTELQRSRWGFLSDTEEVDDELLECRRVLVLRLLFLFFFFRRSSDDEPEPDPDDRRVRLTLLASRSLSRDG